MSIASTLARKQRMIAAGLCLSCGKGKASQARYCAPCYARHKILVEKRRKRLLLEGKCISCGAPQSRASSRFCEVHRKVALAANRRLSLYRGAHGICKLCPRPAREDRVHCQRCAQTIKRVSKRRYERLKAERRCLCCALALKRTERLRCRQCRLKESIRQKIRMDRLISEGRCQSCGKPRGELGTSRECRPCANRHSSREILRQKRRKAGIPARRT